MPKSRVGVAVLGDLGRSPRMQYHAHSLARHGHPVHLVGYPGSPLPDSLATNTHVTVRHRKLECNVLTVITPARCGTWPRCPAPCPGCRGCWATWSRRCGKR